MPNAIQLTEKQTELLEAIRKFRQRHGYNPSNAELAKTFGISTVRVWQQIKQLEIARAIKMVGTKPQVDDLIPYSEKQYECARMFAKHPGATQTEIAAKLKITPETLNADYLPRLVAIGAIEVNEGIVKVLDKGL